MRFFPRFSQYRRWSLPSKLTFWGFWIGVFSLVFAIFQAPILSTLSGAIKDSRVRFVLTGVWEAEAARNGAIYVPVENAQSFQFNVSSNNGANICFIEGEASWEKDAFVYRDSFSDCSIEIIPDRALDKLQVVRSQGCLGMCGLGADFGGTYIRKPLLLNFEGGLTSIEDAKLQIFLGGIYDEVSEVLGKQTVVERDNGGYTVISGYEKGLFPYISAIAVIDAQSISVGYSINSDPQMLFSDYRHNDNPPFPLKDWFAKFKDLNLGGTTVMQAERFTPPAWCSNASTTVETIICVDKDLSLLDNQINVSFQNAIARVNSDTAATIRATQRAWLANRDKCETDRQCVADSYHYRIRKLKEYQ